MGFLGFRALCQPQGPRTARCKDPQCSEPISLVRAVQAFNVNGIEYVGYLNILVESHLTLVLSLDPSRRMTHSLS